MIELHATIPDPDAVLVLEPEELAAALLALMRRRGEAEAFSVHDMKQCPRCNSEKRSKSDREYIDWLKEIGEHLAADRRGKLKGL